MFMHFFGHDFSVTISRLMLLSFVVGLPFVVGGCGGDDNPIHGHDDSAEPAHAHADPEGFALTVDGTEVYRQLQGNDNGSLTVEAGDEIEVHVEFLDEDGTEVHVGEGKEGSFELGLSEYDPAIIEIHLSEEEAGHAEDEHAEDEHGDEEQFRFEVVGLKVGTTGIKLQLIHADHPDFTAALLIPVTVQ